MTVAPLTSAVLSEVGPKHAGIASAVNNAVARVAGLIAVALVGIITGPHLNVQGFHRALIAIAVSMAVGGAISFVGIRTNKAHTTVS